MGAPRGHHTAALTVAALRAGLIESARYTAQVMGELAKCRDATAAGYRNMARYGGPHAPRYRQHAERLEQAAARARRFAEQELEQIRKWQQRDGGQDAGA